MRRRIRKAKVVACLRYCLRACMGQPYKYVTKLRYGDLRVENKISGLTEYEDGGSACSTATFKGQNFVTCISQRSTPTREISLHLSLVSSRMKPTDDTIQAFRCKKAIRSIENVQKNIKAPHTASSKETPTLVLKSFCCPTSFETKNMHTAFTQVKVFNQNDLTGTINNYNRWQHSYNFRFLQSCSPHKRTRLRSLLRLSQNR